MKRDILFLCQFFYPEHNSSATLPFDTAKYLAAHGFTVDALCGYPKEYNFDGQVPLKETVEGVNIHRIKYIQPDRRKKISRLVNYFSFTFSALLHIGTLRRYKNVIVYSNPPVLPVVPVLANLLFDTRFVFVAYDVYPEVAYASHTLRPGDHIDKGMKRLNHAIYKRASMIVALTGEMRQFLLKNRPELDGERICVIPNWAHESGAYQCADAKERFGFSEKQFVVGYYGNMGVCQEMETLLAAMKELSNRPEFGFLFVGHGRKKERVEQFIEEEGIENAKVCGFLVGEEFEQALAAADCCVVSLEKGLMGTCAPSKYYSYLQAGKPVLAVVEEGSYLQEEIRCEDIGRAVCVGDAEGLADAIEKLRAQPNERKGMSLRASELYDRAYRKGSALEKYVQMLGAPDETARG